MTRRLVIHIGAPKTGTTYLQAVLRANQDALREAGFELAAERQRALFAASNDLFGRLGTPLTEELRDEGAWDAMATRLRASETPTVIYSDERLAALSRRGIARVAELGNDREIHLVYATRELGTLMPSAWQEHVKHGSQETIVEWSERILRSDPSVARRFFFWRVHDVARVLARWSAAAATPQRVHVISFPKQSGGSEDLWTRFAVAIGLPPELDVTTAVSRSNPALDHAQVEFLRRVNEELGDALTRAARMRWVRDVLSKSAMSGLGFGPRAVLPEHLVPDVEARAAASIEYLASSEHTIIGDLDDLVPTPPSSVEGPTHGEVLDAAVTAMAALLESLNRRFGSTKPWTRFAVAIGQPPELDVTTPVSRSNPALDHAQVEFLRRVNEELGDALTRAARMRLVRVIGDLSPSASSPGEDPTQDEVLDAAVTTMAALIESLNTEFGSRKPPFKGPRRQARHRPG